MKKDEQGIENLMKESTGFVNGRYETPLHLTVWMGSSDMVSFFLRRTDVDPNARDLDGKTAFLLACEFGLEEHLEIFLKFRKVSTHLADTDGRTPLYHAGINVPDFLKFMIASGRELDFQTTLGHRDFGKLPSSAQDLLRSNEENKKSIQDEFPDAVSTPSEQHRKLEGILDSIEKKLDPMRFREDEQSLEGLNVSAENILGILDADSFCSGSEILKKLQNIIQGNLPRKMKDTLGHFLVNLSRKSQEHALPVNVIHLEIFSKHYDLTRFLSRNDISIFSFGEGNFTFSLALASFRHSRFNIYPSTLDEDVPSFDVARKKCIKGIEENNKINRISVLQLPKEDQDDVIDYLRGLTEFTFYTRVNATELKNGYGTVFDQKQHPWVLFFQCPWEKATTQAKDPFNLVIDFLRSASHIMQEDDIVCVGVTIHKTYFSRYKLGDINNFISSTFLEQQHLEYVGYDRELIANLLQRGYTHSSKSDHNIHELIFDHHVTISFKKINEPTNSLKRERGVDDENENQDKKRSR